MILTRHGNCAVCGVRCKESREFITTIDLFNQASTATINASNRPQIVAWRKTKLYCDNHKQGDIDVKGNSNDDH